MQGKWNMSPGDSVPVTIEGKPHTLTVSSAEYDRVTVVIEEGAGIFDDANAAATEGDNPDASV